MKEHIFAALAAFGKCLALSLVLISFTRLLLYWLNPDFFQLEVGEVFSALWYGLRFDISALVAYQLPFILLFFIPVINRWEKLKQALLGFFFALSNFLLIVLNCVDSIYYRFILKRSTADVFKFISTSDDTLRLIPQFAADYWYMIVLALALWGLSVKGYKHIEKPLPPKQLSASYIYYNFMSLVIAVALGVLAIRGGVQLKPLRPLHAVEVVGLQKASLVLNTPFTIMKTLYKKGIEQKSYFSENELRQLYTPVFVCKAQCEGMKRKNVVLIIMESFSKEYMGPPFGLEGRTPFLDSLAKEGLFFNRAYANAKKSIEGIPAVLAGIPALMDEPYITSGYSNNPLDAVGMALKEEGYQTAFFHGGKKGTMGFDGFASLAGFEAYYGMEDFDGADGYDGNWGIYDEPFFQFFGRKLKSTREPFFATFFSLSSHHPYKIPEAYEHVYTGAKHPVLNTVSYADMALKKFFEQVKESPWYGNTLFVITADHTGQSFNAAYATQLGNFAVPLLFFSPGDNTFRKGVSERVTQQTDIPVSILDYLQYKKPFFSFGKSCLNEQEPHEGFALNYLNSIYQFVNEDYVLHFDGEKTIGFYNYKSDSLLQQSLLEEEVYKPLLQEKENKCRAVIQTYQEALLRGNQKASFY